MSIPHILTEILNRPLMITPAKLQVIMGILDNRSGKPLNLDLSALADMSSAHGGEQSAVQRPAIEAEQPHIAVITIRGSLVARNHGFDDSSGMRSYRTVQREIQDCMRDPGVGGIMLDIDSYGGMSAGCERLARFIRGCTAVKPIYAVVDLNAYSAGYEIAAACSKVILTDATAGVGSIGCIAIHCDMSKWAEKEGLQYTVCTFGAHKDAFSPYRPLTEGEAAELQKSVAAHGNAFAQTIAEFRGLKIEQILDMQARCFTGQAAIDVGLADEIATFDVAALMLAKDIERSSAGKDPQVSQSSQTETGGSTMTTKDRIEALLAADDGPEAMSSLGFIHTDNVAGAGYVAADAAAESEKTAVESAVQACCANSAAVAEIAMLAKIAPEKLSAMLAAGMSESEARATAQALNATKSKQQQISSTTTPLSGSDKHPLIAAAEKMRGGKA